MNKSYEYRIYPTKEQKEYFSKILGMCRLYWNIIVFNKRQDTSMYINGYKPTFEKYRPEALEWVKEIDTNPLSQTWIDIRKAYSQFFKSCKKQRKGKPLNPPRFKNKKNPKNSFRYATYAGVKFSQKGILITQRLGWIKGSFGCRFCEGKIKNVTFKKTSSGKWFVKICVEKKDEPKNKNNKVIAIDWNCRDKDFLVRNDGVKIKCPRFYTKSLKQLIHYQKLMKKKFVIGQENQSINYEKARIKTATLLEHISNQRKDFLHKESRKLCNEFQTIVVEDINLQQIIRKTNLGKITGDQGFGLFRQMLAYKGELKKVNPKNTSKTCCKCGFINPKVTVGINYWVCPVCGENHDRDINAATNILNKYLSEQKIVGWELTEIINACGEPSCSMKQENELTSLETV